MSAFSMPEFSAKDLDRLPYLHWGWFLVFGLIIACISATMLHLSLQIQGKPSVWHTTFLIKLAVWWFWSCLSYGVFLLSKKIRFNRGQWLAGILFHLMFSLITVGLNILFYALLIKILVLPGAEFGFGGVYVNVFLNQFEWFFIMYWAIILVGYAFDYYQRFRQEEVRSVQFESRMVEAQLQALKMQLHPHFLFNTLNTISAMIRQNESAKANDMLIRLSDFLRRTLMMKEEQEISLAEELTFIRQYLDIEQIRFQKELEIRYAIGEEAEPAMVPNLLLQPLVENARRRPQS
ncbi:MAG: histidine kinase, partial [Bacteroidota bacterium]